MKKDIFENFVFTLIVLAGVASIAFFAAEADSNERTDLKTLMARSCIGEAGWNAHFTGECAAILHIYKKRSEIADMPIEKVVRKYSATIKPRPDKPNKFVLHIKESCEQPDKWPKNMLWERYKDSCLKTFETVDMFLSGELSDPLPRADHYGSEIDHHRAVAAGWKKLKTPFKNWFYRVPRRKK